MANADEIARLLSEQGEVAEVARDLASRAQATAQRAKPLTGESASAISQAVSDPVTHRELDAKLGQSKAEGETQFEKLRGDIRELKGASVGKATFTLGLLALFAALLAVLAYGGQWFGLGLQSHDALVTAAKEGAAQALAARR